jgi:hypothetical protein
LEQRSQLQALSRTAVTAPGNGVLARLSRGWSSFQASNPRVMDAGRRAGGLAGVAGGVYTAATQGGAAVRSLGDAFTAARRGDTAEARRQLGAAGNESLAAARGAGTAVRGAVTFQNVATARRGATAAVESFRAAGGAAGLTAAAARTAEATVAGAGARIATAAAGGVSQAAASVEVGRRALTSAALHAGTETAARAGEVAAEAALRAGARAGASTLGRAAGRLVPGVNVAMAAVDSTIAARDTYNAVQHPTPRNIGRAAFSGLTAVGSIAAATNIPVVSQIGAGASAVTGFVAALF